MFEIESFWSLTFIWQDSISLPGLVGFTGPTSCLTLLLVHEDSQGFFLWLAKIHSRGWPESSFQLKSLSELEISSIPKKSTQRVWVKAKKIKQAFILSRFWCQLTQDLNQQSWATIFGSSSFLNSELGISSVEVTRKPTPCGSTMFHQPKNTLRNSGHVATCPVSGSMLVNAWNLGWWVQWSRPMDLLPVLLPQQWTLPFCLCCLHPNFMS